MSRLCSGAADRAKEEGSYEQASYAIRGTPKAVAEHYGFLPRDNAALAARSCDCFSKKSYLGPEPDRGFGSQILKS